MLHTLKPWRAILHPRRAVIAALLLPTACVSPDPGAVDSPGDSASTSTPGEVLPAAPSATTGGGDEAVLAIVEAQVHGAYPGAELVEARDVFDPAGSPLGVLLTFDLATHAGPARHVVPGDTLFAGADLLSVLAAWDVDLPLTLAVTSGAPVGFPEGGRLAYAVTDQVWLSLDDAGVLRDALTGEEVSAATLPDPVVDADLAAENRADRFAAEREWLQREAAAVTCVSPYGNALTGGTFSRAGSTLTARSNGANYACTWTGSGTYQCVHWIDQVHPVTQSHYGNANSYNDGTNPRKMGMRYFSNNNGTYPPVKGDIAISEGPVDSYGHVAIVSSVSGSTVTFMDQNWSATLGTHTATLSGTNLGSFSASYPVAGWSRPGYDFSNAIDTVSSIYNWTKSGGVALTAVDSTAVTMNPGSDPYITGPTGMQLDGSLYKKVKVRLSSKAPDGNVRVYFTTAAYPTFSESRSAATTVTTDGTYRTVTVDMSGNSYWTGGVINQIRLDPCNNGNAGSTDTIAVDAIWLEP